MLQEINVGGLAAEEDDHQHFRKHFIQTPFFDKLVSNNTDIVFGAKGVGKTALMRALTELKHEYFHHSIAIDLSSISFEAIHSKLTSLQNTTKTELPNLSRTTWKNILISYGLLAYSEKLSPQDELRLEILKVLKEDNFIQDDYYPGSYQTNFQVMNTIENFFIKIASIPVEGYTLGLSPAQQSIVDKSPLNEKLAYLLQKSITTIVNSKSKILVALDGFDSIVDHNPITRKPIFAGLIDAILKLSTDKHLSSAFCFKAFLPQELTIDATRIAWDIDKHIDKLHYLRWAESDFKSLITRRLAQNSKKKSNKFNEVWNEFLPERIINPTHNIEELLFDYIIRHTLYRPRQVLTHIKKILTGWYNYKSTTMRVDPSYIPQIVANTNIEMAHMVASQLSIVYPNILVFLKSWQGSSCIIEAKIFRDRIRKFFPNLSHTESDSLFDELFNFGVIGTYSLILGTNQNKKLNFAFAFIGDNISSYVHTYVSDNDLVAFSPMFREFCGCVPCVDGYICPVSLNGF